MVTMLCTWSVSFPMSTQHMCLLDRLSAIGLQEGGARDLAKLLGNAQLEHSFSVEVMRSGVVAFAQPERATAFRDLLEADGHVQVLISEMASHTLFLEAVGSGRSGVVVLMADEGYLPTPAQLAAALRHKRSFEDL